MSSKESTGISSQTLLIAVKLPYFLCAIVGAVKGNDSGSKAATGVNREGKAMLFLIRAAFWLMIIVLLLPTDDRQRSEVYGTAQAAVNDVASFCDRNPETCARGKDAFAVFVQKGEFGARMLMDLVQNKTGAGAAAGAAEPTRLESPLPEMQSPDAAAFAKPIRFDMNASQDTLNPEDREEAWSGPDSAGT